MKGENVKLRGDLEEKVKGAALLEEKKVRLEDELKVKSKELSEMIQSMDSLRKQNTKLQGDLDSLQKSSEEIQENLRNQVARLDGQLKDQKKASDERVLEAEKAVKSKEAELVLVSCTCHKCLCVLNRFFPDYRQKHEKNCETYQNKRV